MSARILVGLLFLVGLWGLVSKRHLIKKIFGLSILNAAVVILFVVEGAGAGDNAPIMESGVVNIVDPIPPALALAMAFSLYKATGSFDIDEIRRRIADAQ